jgi:hypothetical protein
MSYAGGPPPAGKAENRVRAVLVGGMLLVGVVSCGREDGGQVGSQSAAAPEDPSTEQDVDGTGTPREPGGTEEPAAAFCQNLPQAVAAVWPDEFGDEVPSLDELHEDRQIEQYSGGAGCGYASRGRLLGSGDPEPGRPQRMASFVSDPSDIALLDRCEESSGQVGTAIVVGFCGTDNGFTGFEVLFFTIGGTQYTLGFSPDYAEPAVGFDRAMAGLGALVGE